MANIGLQRGIIGSAADLYTLPVESRIELQDAAVERIRDASDDVSIILAHLVVRCADGFLCGFTPQTLARLNVTGIVLLAAYSGEVYDRQVMKVGGKRAVASSPIEIELFQRLVESSVVQQSMTLAVPFEVVENSQELVQSAVSSVLAFVRQQELSSSS